MKELIVRFDIKTRMEVTNEEYEIMCTIPEHPNDGTMEDLEKFDSQREELFEKKRKIISRLEEKFSNLEKENFISLFIPTVADEDDNCIYEW